VQARTLTAMNTLAQDGGLCRMGGFVFYKTAPNSIASDTEFWCKAPSYRALPTSGKARPCDGSVEMLLLNGVKTYERSRNLRLPV
jgi:hypothetical protein